MTHSSQSRPFAHTYVVKLAAPCDRANHPLRGRVENVFSGRQQEFADGQALLTCIQYEESLALQEAIAYAQWETPDAP